MFFGIEPPSWFRRHLRWRVIGVLCLVTVLNYVDRQTLSVVAPILARPPQHGGLGMTPQQYGYITFAFLLTYGAGQFLTGGIFDKLGSRLGFVLAVAWWAVAAFFHRFVHTVLGFGFWRALLGLGEAGNWPGAAKVIAEWFPVHERGWATGVFLSGSSIGAIFGPPIIVWITLHFGWRNAFVLTGVLALLWSFVWLRFYHVPSHHPRITDQELQFIAEGQESVAVEEAARKVPMRHLLRYREAWGIFLARSLSDPVWWFYLFWLPAYLVQERKLSFETLWLAAMLPYITSDLGSLTGGGLSSLFIRKGWSVNRARKTVMVASALLMPAPLFVLQVRGPWAAVALICLATFAHSSWSTNLLVLPADLFPARFVGSVTGLAGLGIAASAFAQLAVGQVVAHFSYRPVFIAAGLLHPAAAICMLLLIRRIQQVRLTGA